MAQNIFRCIALKIDKSTNEGRAISNGDDHTDPDCTDIVRRQIVGSPSLITYQQDKHFGSGAMRTMSMGEP
jgi:hypothetical protein